MPPSTPASAMETLGRGDIYPWESFKRGVRVWIRDEERVWAMAELLEDVTPAKASVQLRLLSDGSGGETITYAVDPKKMPFLCNPDILLGRDDLTELSYLHEPAVLHNLHNRFIDREAIYTYCGIVLVAINPYCECPHLYSEDVIRVYRGQGKQVRDFLPHIYAIAEEAHFDLSEYGKNQSVVISGESGAGKTVSARFVMAYLASVAAPPSPFSPSSATPSSKSPQCSGVSTQAVGIERRVIASNPIMEAIGNAKTLRNDNSSRFGKFIQINFQPQPSRSIAGAEMRTYLLEKSRVVFQAVGERNYHIFYQLCEGAANGHPLTEGLGLGPATDFHYTNNRAHQQHSQQVVMQSLMEVDGVNDGEEFLNTVRSFDTLGIGWEEQRKVTRLLAAIIHLGNVDFTTIPAGSDGSPAGGNGANNKRTVICKDSLSVAEKLCGAELLDMDTALLSRWLCNREIRAGSDVVRKALSVEEALANRDALAKALYSHLFNWIVARLNASLSSDGHQVGNKARVPLATGKAAVQAEKRFIGVLDIYGFEMFELNSFEQFCINYANEKLQQQFNQHVFKLEQAEYEREQISWIRIEFHDNQACIDLIEARPRSLIDYLDEQCKTGRGTDEDWLVQIRECKHLRASGHLELPKASHTNTFTVKHFAAEVRYTVDSFVEKNKDTVNEQLLQAIGTSRFPFVGDVLREALTSSTSGSARKRTVAVQFRDSLRDLIQVLSSTRPHYVRCIKPNDEKLRFTFHPQRAIQQLRACGVLETVRISATGFPSRWAYKEFAHRYRVLRPPAAESPSALAAAEGGYKEFACLICDQCLGEGNYALGKSKVFFRTGQVAKLEKLRKDKLWASATLIQACWRGRQARQQIARMRLAIRNLQAMLRSYLMQRQIEELQERRRLFHQVDSTILGLQSRWRGNQARQGLLRMQHEKMAVDLQRHARGCLARREYRARIHHIVVVQCWVRRWLAKRRFRELRAEARTVAGQRRINKGLELKIISLQQRLDFAEAEKRRILALFEQLASVIRDQSNGMRGQLAGIKLDVETNERSLRGEMENSRVLTAQQMAASIQEFHQLSERSPDTALLEEVNRLKELIQELESKLEQEDSTRTRMQQQAEEMRAQLLSNTELLASADFTEKHRLVKADIVDTEEETSFFAPDMDLAMNQKCLITELRLKLDAKNMELQALQQRLATRELAESEERCSSERAYNRQYLQDTEMELVKSREELKQVCEAASKKGRLDFQLHTLLEQRNEDNDRLKDECRELRSILIRKYEHHAQQSVEPNGQRNQLQRRQTDSGHGTDGSSNESHSPSPQCDEGGQLLDQLVDSLSTQRYYKKLWEESGKELERRASMISELQAQQTRKMQIGATSPTLTNGAVGAAGGLNKEARSSEETMLELLEENSSLQRTLARESDELAEARAQLCGYSLHYASKANGAVRSGAGAAGDAKQLNCNGAIANGYTRGGTEEITRLGSLNADSKVLHSGLLEVFNISEFVRILIDDLKPQFAKRLPARLPAHLLLCAFRYFDHAGNDASLTALFNRFHASLKEHIVDTCCELDSLSLWLANCWCLLRLLERHSKSETAVENDGNIPAPLLINYDLKPVREQLAYRVDDLYSNLMKKTVEPLLLPKVVPALLQHESRELEQLLHGEGATAARNKSRGDQLTDLLEFLSFIHHKLAADYGSDSVLIEQVFAQIGRWMCASALNHLIFRKEFCTANRAIAVRHNISEVQHWFRAHELPTTVGATLEPLVQACHLLQIPKSEKNVDDLCGEMTNKLGRRQILAILKNFSPGEDGFAEERIGEELLRMVDTRLTALRSNEAVASNERNEASDELLMKGTCLARLDYSNGASKASQKATNAEPALNLDRLELPKLLGLHRVARFV